MPSPRALLVIVAVLHAASPLVVLGAHYSFGIDETVYLSQLNAHVPAGLFSAPRARGPTLIAAPITLLTSSTAAVRVWVAALSGLGLYLGFVPWLRLRAGYAVPLAALLFSTLWTVIFYGFTVMPNEWVAYATLGCTGLLLRYAADGHRWQLFGAGLALAVVGLMRPSDALYLGVALGGCCLFLRASRRRRALAAVGLAVGFCIGVVEWLVEAAVRYRGILARIHAAQAENGGGGVHFAGAAQARALAGPVLCRVGCHAHAAFGYQLWWLVLTALLIVAMIGVRRAARPEVDWVPACAGLACAAQYVFAVTYAAPRFLIPAYALLCLPAAAGLWRVVRAPRKPMGRVLVGSLFALALVVQAVTQLQVITWHIEPPARRAHQAIVADGQQLRSLGVRSPCLVLGNSSWNQELAYVVGCSNTSRTGAMLRRKLAAGTKVIWLTHRQPVIGDDVAWRRVQLHQVGAESLVAYVGIHRPEPRSGSRFALRRSHG